jgi:hypothetical protein
MLSEVSSDTMINPCKLQRSPLGLCEVSPLSVRCTKFNLACPPSPLPLPPIPYVITLLVTLLAAVEYGLPAGRRKLPYSPKLLLLLLTIFFL